MSLLHSFLNPSSRCYYLLRGLVLILLGWAIYGQAFGFNFVFDDNFFILDNPYIRSLDQINQIWSILPKTRLVGIYSFVLNYQINQLHPQGYHIFNFIIHLLAVGVVWALASLLFKITGKANPELAFVIAAIFLVHPCQTQAVTYISQRFESMAALFYISSIYCYLCGRLASLKTHKVLLFLCSVGFAILGILTKETAVTIPLMILAIEFIFFRKDSLKSKKSISGQRYLLIAVLGGIFILFFMKIVRINIMDIFFHFSAPSESHEGDVITGGKYVLTQMRVFLTFIRLLILPIHQNLDYDYPLSTGLFDPPLTLAGLCLIGFIAFLIFSLRKKWPLIAFGLAWVLITFSINIAPRANVIFEHKLYLISFGFFLATVTALSNFIKDRKILFGLLIIFIGALSLLSYKRNHVWNNELTLWSDVVQKSPQKARGYNSLGVFYGRQGDYLQSLADLSKAIEINPNDAETYNNRGNTYLKLGQFNQAKVDLNKAIILNPDYAEAYANRADIANEQGNIIQALLDYNKAIEINPNYVDAYLKRGIFYDKQGNFTQALLDYNKVIEINPYFALGYYHLGLIFAKEGNFNVAMFDFNEAIKIDPGYVEAYINRGTCYAQQGNYDQSLLDYNSAIAINPNSPEVYFNRAVSYYQLKEYEMAWQDVDEAKALGFAVNPRFISALKQSSDKYQ